MKTLMGFHKNEDGDVSIKEGGVYTLVEGDLARMSDEDLRALRNTMIAARKPLIKLHQGMDDSKRFSTPEGRQLFEDICYYDQIIRQVEWEMGSVRYLTL